MTGKFDNVEVLLEGLDENNITSILTKYEEINKVRRTLVELENMLKDKIKIYLKERKWERYSDKETNISVTLSTQQREVLDKKQLTIMLTDSQMAQVMRTTTFEKMNIITPEARERLKKYVRKN